MTLSDIFFLPRRVPVVVVFSTYRA